MKKLLILLKVIETKKIIDSFKITHTKERLNPYNPLSYIVLLITFIVGTIMFGFVGFWREINIKESMFKWF
jgi:hypothetical protein